MKGNKMLPEKHTSSGRRWKKPLMFAVMGAMLLTGVPGTNVYADQTISAAPSQAGAVGAAEENEQKTVVGSNAEETTENGSAAVVSAPADSSSSDSQSTDTQSTSSDTSASTSADSSTEATAADGTDSTGEAAESTDSTDVTADAGVDMYRMYNPNTKEHFYTGSLEERQNLLKAGWNYEGVGWTAPTTSDVPVYRLYNTKSKVHHFTTNTEERDSLTKGDWKYEGVGWYSDPAQQVPVYRQYNPKTGAHNYTASQAENDSLVSKGWKAEGIAFYGMPDPDPSITNPVTWYNGVDYSLVYDYSYYVSHNQDLVSATANDGTAIANYVKKGIPAGRTANETFDPISYQNANQDLRKSYGEDIRKYVLHYIRRGKKEGRTAWGVPELQNPVTTYAGVDLSPVYDYYYYRDHNPAVVQKVGRLDVSLIKEFATDGMNANRAGKESYDQNTYASLHNRVLATMDPLLAKAQGYDSYTGYLVLIDKTNHNLEVFQGSKGNWKGVHKNDVSVGANDTPTVEGVFRVGIKTIYFDSGTCRCWYATQFYGDYMMHSILYFQDSSPVHVMDGRLNENISHGCVRMKLENAKWIYDNVPSGTTVVVFS